MCGPRGKQVHQKRDYCKNKQQVNQRPCDVKYDKAENPSNEQDGEERYEQIPEHETLRPANLHLGVIIYEKGK